MSNIIKRKQIDGKLTLGPINSTYGITNTPKVNNTDTYETAFDKVIDILDKLVPPAPPSLNDVDIEYTGTYYSGFISGTVTPVSAIIGTITPTFNTPLSPLQYFGDATKGSLKLDTNITTLNLTTADDTNTDITVAGKIVKILNDTDYYLGQPSKEGFWYAMRAEVKYTILGGLTPATTPFSFLLENWSDINAGGSLLSSVTKQFYVESAIAPIVSNVMLDTVTPYVYISNKKISGVPVFATNDIINLRFNMTNVAKKFYKNLPTLFSSTNNTFIPATVWNWLTPPAIDSTQTNNLIQLIPVINKYQTGIALTMIATDVLNQNSAPVSIIPAEQVKLRIDTLSVETNLRKLSSATNNVYEKSFVTPYNTDEVIVGNALAAYNFELQLEGGIYKYPSSNYSTYYPINTINYTAQTGMRYATFLIGTIEYTKQIIINTPGVSNILKGTTSLVIQVLVENLYGAGLHGWVDACTNYYTATSPQQNDINTAVDGALGLINGSTATTRTITVHTGNIAYGGNTGSTKNVYVRIGWSHVDSAYVLSERPTLVGIGGGGSFTAL